MERPFSYHFLTAFLLTLPFFTHLSSTDAAPYKVVPVKNGGSIKGQITFKGTPPDPRKIRIIKNPEFCGEGFREVTWVRVNNGGLAEVVVYLKDVREGKDWPPITGEVEHLDDLTGKDTPLVHEGKYLLDQKNCRFHPWIRVYKKGADIVVRNSDPVQHSINFREVVGRVMKSIFLISQTKKGDIFKKIKTTRNNFIRINCEPHNFMFSWGLAAENPYAVVVSSNGTYEITDIPAGSYKLMVWHPILGVKEASVEIPAGGSVQKDFQYVKKER